MALSVGLSVFRFRWLALALVAAGLAAALGWRTLQAGALTLQAAAVLQPYIQQQGEQSDGITCLGQALDDAAGRAAVQRAAGLLERAVQLAPDRAYAYFLLGRAHCLLGDYAAAARALPLFTEQRSTNPQADLERGFALEQLCPPAGECPAYSAVEAWQRADVRPEHFVGRGEAARQAEQYPQAIEWYQRAQQMGADLRSAILYVRYLQALAGGQDEAAYTALRDAVDIDSGWADAGIRFLGWYRYGQWLSEKFGDYPATVEVMQRAISIFPEKSPLKYVLSDAYRYIGFAQLFQGNTQDAVNNFRTAVNIDPTNGWARIGLGKALYRMDPEKIAEVETNFSAAIEWRWENKSIWQDILIFWVENNHPDQAARVCAQADQKGMVVDSCTGIGQ